MSKSTVPWGCKITVSGRWKLSMSRRKMSEICRKMLENVVKCREMSLSVRGTYEIGIALTHCFGVNVF